MESRLLASYLNWVLGCVLCLGGFLSSNWDFWFLLSVQAINGAHQLGLLGWHASRHIANGITNELN